MPDEFGAEVWQGRPRGGYWLPREFHTWPEIRAAKLGVVGLFVYHGIWATTHDVQGISRQVVKRYGYAEWVRDLVDLGLWAEDSDGYTWRTMADLRAGRGRPGLVMLLSRLLHSAPELLRAGAMPAFGLWALTASWSLDTDTPGFVPAEIARSFGKTKHAAELWDRGLWIVTEHGFRMHQGTNPVERRWALTRDDTRADIPPELRARVFARDWHRCVECGTGDDLTLDHIIPWSHGGPDTFDNLRTLCRPCNSSKGDRTP